MAVRSAPVFTLRLKWHEEAVNQGKKNWLSPWDLPWPALKVG